MSRYCQECGTITIPSANYCEICGNRIVDVSEAKRNLRTEIKNELREELEDDLRKEITEDMRNKVIHTTDFQFYKLTTIALILISLTMTILLIGSLFGFW
jgi:uncharacterized membrane protein YvbJ